jgi:hypothetical protein
MGSGPPDRHGSRGHLGAAERWFLCMNGIHERSGQGPVTLSIPAVRDWVVQGALKPHTGADLQPCWRRTSNATNGRKLQVKWMCLDFRHQSSLVRRRGVGKGPTLAAASTPAREVSSPVRSRIKSALFRNNRRPGQRRSPPDWRCAKFNTMGSSGHHQAIVDNNLGALSWQPHRLPSAVARSWSGC